MQDQEERVREVQSTLKECFQQMRFASATELARSRRFLEAEALLVPHGRLPESSCELDLLARIAAQQGQFEKARQCWKAALQHEPAHLAYETDIKAVGQAEKAAATKKTIGLVSVAVGFVALCTSLVLFWPWKKAPPPKPPIHSIQPSAPRQQATEPSPAPVSVRFQLPGPTAHPEK